MKDFNIREFYKENKAREEASFSHSTGLTIRHFFQQYNEGDNCEDVFAVKSISKKECIGIEFHGSISYMLPVSHHEVLVFIYDASLMPIINELLNWSEPKLKVVGRHIPSLMNGISNAVQFILTDVGVFVDEDMLCFVKQIEYPLFEKINDGCIAEPKLIGEVLALIQYRNQCEQELSSFEGFTQREKNEIILKEGLAFVKKRLRIMRFMDYVSVDD